MAKALMISSIGFKRPEEKLGQQWTWEVIEDILYNKRKGKYSSPDVSILNVKALPSFCCSTTIFIFRGQLQNPGVVIVEFFS
ncbi:MAG: hypothetical protein AAF985_17895 [Bacteroidota bacterium]